MRKPCPFCYLKHVGQAIILFDEFASGYDQHVFLGLAHLAEAAAEIRLLDPDLAEKTDEQRRMIEGMLASYVEGEAGPVDVVSRFAWQDLVASASTYIAGYPPADVTPVQDSSDDSDDGTP